jgi:hypothetical protein
MGKPRRFELRTGREAPLIRQSLLLGDGADTGLRRYAKLFTYDDSAGEIRLDEEHRAGLSAEKERG